MNKYKFHFNQTKLLIQIFVLKHLLRFIKWHNKRWDAYFKAKEWDRWFNTLAHMKKMDKYDRSLILQILPYKELEEAMQWKALTHLTCGGDMI